MKNKILVLIKYSQDEVAFFDQSALECALQIPDSEVTVLTMLPLSNKDKLENLTRLGLNVILLSDKLYAGSDTFVTSKILAKAISKIDYDYIFIGKQSTDGDTGQVPTMISSILDIPLLGYVKDYKNGFLYIDNQPITLKKNTIYIFDKFLSLRFPSLFSSKNNITIWDNSIIGMKKEECGIEGSPTRVIRNYENNQDRRFPVDSSIKDLDSLIKISLEKSSKRKETTKKQKIQSIVYFGDIKDKVLEIADIAIEINNKDKNINNIVNEIIASNSKVILFEDTIEYRLLSSKLAILLNSGLCADCTDFRVENGNFILTRPAFGGNIIADIICISEYSLATVKTQKNTNDIIFTVGKGAIDYLDQIKELAAKYNAEVCSTRDLVDLGVMPYSSQVGLTGKFVYPKTYVTFGVSGAVQHTCGISGCGTIISINKDPKARIFTYSDYRIVDDIKNLF